MNVTVQIPTEPSYYGSDTTAEEVPMIADRLESMILNEFGWPEIKFVFERVEHGNRVTCPEAPDIAEDISRWIAAKWTRAI